MFDIGWSELLILAVVTLVFLGPKEMLSVFRTLGRYAGMIQRQATEFRRHFEDAMQEAEFDEINKQVMDVKDQVASSLTDAERAVRQGVDSVKDAASDATRAAETGGASRPPKKGGA